jgi:hypothetical protein
MVAENSTLQEQLEGKQAEVERLSLDFTYQLEEQES